MQIIRAALAGYFYCRSDLGANVHMQVCEDSLECAYVTKSQSIYENSSRDFSGAQLRTCAFVTKERCKETCSRDCIPLDITVSYLERFGDLQGPGELLANVSWRCPYGKYSAKVVPVAEPVQAVGTVCAKKWNYGGNPGWSTVSGPSRVGCSQYRADMGSSKSPKVPIQFLDNAIGLLFPAAGYTADECGQYCTEACEDQIADPGLFVLERSVPNSGYYKLVESIAPPYQCPKGKQKYPTESDKPDENSGKKKLSNGQLAGIIVAGVLGVLGVGAGVILLVLHQQKHAKEKETHQNYEKTLAERDKRRDKIL